MESDKTARWFSVFANLGVIAGLAILVFELGQTRDLMRAQTRNELSSSIVDHLLNASLVTTSFGYDAIGRQMCRMKPTRVGFGFYRVIA